MFFDLQKASALKRFSAYLLDLILICVLVTGIAFLMSAVLGFDGYLNTFETGYASYEAEWGVDFDISAEDYAKLDDEGKACIDAETCVDCCACAGTCPVSAIAE